MGSVRVGDADSEADRTRRTYQDDVAARITTASGKVAVNSKLAPKLVYCKVSPKHALCVTMIHCRNAEIVRARCPDRGDFGGREQPVPHRDMREGPFEAGRLHADDRYWTRAMLGMYLVLEILIGGDPLRLDALLPQDAAGCLVGRRNPGLGLAD